MVISAHSFGPEPMFKLDESSASFDELSFWAGKAGFTRHYFCPTCGVHLFWKGIGAFGGAMGVNVRNFDGMKLEDITWGKADGRSL